jgi:long-chain acyl-CoA synthetase
MEVPMADTIPRMFLEQVKTSPDVAAQYSKNEGGEFKPTSYAGLLEDVKRFAAGLLELGLGRGDRVGLISDNRREWMVTDLAVLGLGAADVPRGCDATEGEIGYILGFSECRIAVLENEKQLGKIVARKASMPLLATVILYDPVGEAARKAAEAAGLSVRGFAEVSEIGALRVARFPSEYVDEAAKGRREDRATPRASRTHTATSSTRPTRSRGSSRSSRATSGFRSCRSGTPSSAYSSTSPWPPAPR